MTAWRFHYRLIFSNTTEIDNDLSSSWRKFLEIHPGMVFISREVSDRDKKVLMLLYKELVRPHLKYWVNLVSCA